MNRFRNWPLLASSSDVLHVAEEGSSVLRHNVEEVIVPSSHKAQFLKMDFVLDGHFVVLCFPSDVLYVAEEVVYHVVKRRLAASKE